MKSRVILSALTVLALPAQLSAQANAERIESATQRIAPDIIRIRQSIHQNPELGNREFHTAEQVASHLRSLGLEVHQKIAHTGVVGILRGGRPGPVIAVRADMDALPVTEQTSYPFPSAVKAMYNDQEVGVMHACGHDIHVAVQLGVASVLAGMRAQLPGTVLFVFQPAEEGAPEGEEGGAELMLKEGVFKLARPEAVFGLHAAGALDVGEITYTAGPAYAASDRWSVTLRGQQAHGAAPQLSVDPTVMAAEAVLALQTIRSRNFDPMEPGVVSVGIMRGGERNNIIPMTVYLEGTARTFSDAARDLVEKRMGEILKGIAATNGGTADFVYDRGYPVTVNDVALTRRMVPTIERVLGRQRVNETGPNTASEDFSFFAREVPGFYYSLGTQKPGTKSGGHHTPTFLADDAAIPIGIRVMSNVLLDYLSGGRT